MYHKSNIKNLCVSINAAKRHRAAHMSDNKNKEHKTSLATFFEKSSLVMLGLGFSAGMPNLLAGTGFTMGTWMRDAGVSLTILSLLGLATLFYALKFLWAPLVDRIALPVLDKMLGRRRSWIILTQVLAMVFLFILSMLEPDKQFPLFATLTALLAFTGATHDIAVDAWRIEVSEDKDKLGVLTAMYQWGYRIAFVVTGAIPLYIAQYFNGNIYSHKGWGIAYAAMGAFMILPILATIFAPRELVPPTPRWVAPADIKSRPFLESIEWVLRLLFLAIGACFLAAGLGGRVEPIVWIVGKIYGGLEAMQKSFDAKPFGIWQQVAYAVVGLTIIFVTALPLPKFRTKPSAYFYSAFIAPLEDYFTRFKGVATTILVFICVYRLTEFLLNIAGAMYLDAGYTKAEIATAQKIFGVIVTAFGAGLAGWGVMRFGIFKCLIFGAFSQPLSHVGFLAICYFGNLNTPYLASLGIQPSLWFAIGIDNISASFAGTVFIVYISSLTKAGFTATQYALFTSLYALPGKIVAALSGRIVEAAAHASHTGIMAILTPHFTHLGAGSFEAAGKKMGVTAQALASGYALFFIYTMIMGIFGIFMAFVISNGRAKSLVEHNDTATK